jgi:hypothetical protein
VLQISVACFNQYHLSLAVYACKHVLIIRCSLLVSVVAVRRVPQCVKKDGVYQNTLFEASPDPVHPSWRSSSPSKPQDAAAAGQVRRGSQSAV